jgi:hypothetical protein
MQKIAGGIVLAVLVLAFLPDILAAGAGLLIAMAGIILVGVAFSMGWHALSILAFLGMCIAGAILVHKRTHPEDWVSPDEAPRHGLECAEGTTQATSAPEFMPPTSGRHFKFTFSDGDDESANPSP